MTIKTTLSSQFNIATYADALNNDLKLASQFDQWAAQLNKDQDREQGFGPTGALNWVHGHYPTQKPGGLYQTFIFTKKDDGKIMATATICDDDRGVGVSNGVGQDAFLGFVQVNRDYRGQGIGKAVCQYVEDHIHHWLNQHPEQSSLRVALFTDNPAAAKIYKELGFASEGKIFIKEWDAAEELFAKKYSQTKNITAPVDNITLAASKPPSL